MEVRAKNERGESSCCSQKPEQVVLTTDREIISQEEMSGVSELLLIPSGDRSGSSTLFLCFMTNGSLAIVEENSLLNEHRIMCPPRVKGTIKKIAKKGEYTVAEELITIEFNGESKSYPMLQSWVSHFLCFVRLLLTSCSLSEYQDQSPIDCKPQNL